MFDHGEKRRSERDLPAQAMVVPSTITSLKCIPITHAPPDEETPAFEGAQRHSRVYQSGDSEKPSKQVDPRHGAPLIRFGQPVCNWRVTFLRLCGNANRGKWTWEQRLRIRACPRTAPGFFPRRRAPGCRNAGD